MDGLVSRASMIRLSLHPLPASETSAFNKIRAFSTRRAGLFPFRISVSSRWRSSPRSLTTYFFTEISFAAMIASLASGWRRKRITKSFRIGGGGRLGALAIEGDGQHEIVDFSFRNKVARQAALRRTNHV